MARYIDADIMDFPNTFDEFVKQYGITDEDEVYSNGVLFIPVFRVKQWLKHIKSEDVRPVVRGKWVAVDDYPHEEYECSVCGRIVEVTSANIKPEEEYPYCHCGADMREVEE